MRAGKVSCGRRDQITLPRRARTSYGQYSRLFCRAPMGPCACSWVSFLGTTEPGTRLGPRCNRSWYGTLREQRQTKTHDVLRLDGCWWWQLPRCGVELTGMSRGIFGDVGLDILNMCQNRLEVSRKSVNGLSSRLFSDVARQNLRLVGQDNELGVA